jgi:titin
LEIDICLKFVLCFTEKFGNRDYLLNIEYATPEDDAEYWVVAKNVAGEAKSTAQLIVQSKELGNSH